MKIIGICGGSGSGKTAVSELLEKYGVYRIDADQIYHDMTSRETPCLLALVAEFGDGIVGADGALDRRKLADIVFSNGASDKRARLNEISHQYVLEEMRARIAKAAGSFQAVLVDVPLLFESRFDKECDVVVGVIAEREIRIARICARDGLERSAAERRIAAQTSDSFICSHSDYIIRNNGTRRELSDAVFQVAKKILNAQGDKKMAEKSLGQKKFEELSYKKRNVFEEATPEKIKDIYKYSDGYKLFLDNSKTEREAVAQSVAMLKEAGYTEYRFGDKLSAGDKRYLNHHGKSLIAFRIGSEDIEKSGIRLLAAHIDSPRLDLKQVPLYEDSGMGFFKTHYYGGIKKYQWTSIPLALHGVVIKADGESVSVKLGEDESDPVFYINDLLPHLAQNQVTAPLGTAISGESLNILAGALPYNDDEVSDKIKLTILSLINEKYGISEEDFISAELSLVPAFKARDIGFDRALIGSYGHDDRVCAYPALTALLDTDTKQSVMVVLADKEETGSEGITGMQSDFFVDVIDEIAAALNKNRIVVRNSSKCLSADVTAAYDPNFAEVYEKKNSAIISCGTTMNKFTGARGKSGTSDASAEFVGYVRRVFADNDVIWQTGELGRVDQGGGGTVAKYIANHNIETVDIGVPVISMHAPYEVVSKADVYSTYQAFCSFIK